MNGFRKILKFIMSNKMDLFNFIGFFVGMSIFITHMNTGVIPKEKIGYYCIFMFLVNVFNSALKMDIKIDAWKKRKGYEER